MITAQEQADRDAVLTWFDIPELEGAGGRVSRACADLALAMVARLPDGPERKNGLDRLLEARDWFVRASRRAAR